MRVRHQHKVGVLFLIGNGKIGRIEPIALEQGVMEWGPFLIEGIPQKRKKKRGMLVSFPAPGGRYKKYQLLHASTLRIAGISLASEWCSRTYAGVACSKYLSAGSLVFTGQPQASASSTTLSSEPVSLVCIKYAARRYSSRNCVWLIPPKKCTRAPSFFARDSKLVRSGPSPAMSKVRPCSLAIRIARSWRFDFISRPTESIVLPRTTPWPGVKNSVSM